MTSADEALDATHRRSLYLTSEQLLALGLRDGVNEIEFSVASKFQGRAVITCHVFLWNHDAKVVVSDIDGTITRSDVLGHAAALVGTDWTQRGVASLFTKVAANGYHFVYLSSRSISQAGQTKGVLLLLLILFFLGGGVVLERRISFWWVVFLCACACRCVCVSLSLSLSVSVSAPITLCQLIVVACDCYRLHLQH